MSSQSSSAVEVTPLPREAGSKVNFGASITGVNLNDLDDGSFEKIREAIYVHNVVVVKGQHDLLPTKQFELVHRLDPDAPAEHGFRTTEQGKKSTGILAKLKWYTIPGTAGVQLIGQGYQGDDHFGLKGITMNGVGHASFHADLLSEEDLAKGDTRFGIFHFDGIIYGSYPSRVTTLRSIRVPKGPLLTVRWDDGSGRTMKAQPGATAFISNSQLYGLLTDEEKKLVENSYWEPAPHPFSWTEGRKARSTGLGIAPGGQVLDLDKLPPWTPEKVFCFPMVWMNPVTGERGFQVRSEVVRKIYLRHSPFEEPHVIDDLEYIRNWLNNILDRIMAPEYVSIPAVEEGDVVMFNNWGVIHSAIECPASYGVRTGEYGRLFGEYSADNS
ncbi:Clavaminate synthase-like protein [Eremomyces bilateralis CBS 781.70]|uniref:Clavaminate synthase-like protein n=1 Tax=Eremomyces bilateralis CBS 781.70 TaxID=1392243 RepID=A0A6G1FRP7_9PEZI|nr:Clavaminate synthase-like protein [Eremomyces bilateralis CBS 781.70]KAF1808453.1 Clavaminate synthase-like protein [Eremomyces bilateralis CBS 781.70]